MGRAFLLLWLLVGGLSAATSATAQQQAPPPPTSAETAKIEERLRAQDTTGAIAEYHAMLAANPQNTQAWTGLGVLLYGSGKAAEAADALSHALRLNQAAPRANLFLALSQADLQQCNQAAPVLQRYFGSEPKGKLHRLVGLTLLGCAASSTDAASALSVANELKQDYPGNADVLYAAAELYTRMWNETANELLTAHPDSYRVHQLAAEVNEAQGNFPQAIRQYRLALVENPKLTQMHYRIGQLILRIGDANADEEAMGEFRAELVVNPQSATSALAMGEIERQQNKLTAATADYTLAIHLELGLTEARVGLAQTLLAQHEVDAAESQLHAVIAEHPDNAQAHYALMLAYRGQGKLPEAAAELASFQHLQQGSVDQFRSKLNALLTGNATPATSASSAGPAQ